MILFFRTLIPLPELTPEGYRIVLFRIFEHSSSDVPNVDTFTKANQMIIDLLFRKERNSGLIMIYDFQHVSAAFVAVLLNNSKQFLTITTVSVTFYKLDRYYICEFICLITFIYRKF